MTEFIVTSNLIVSFVNVVIMIFIATRKKEGKKEKGIKCNCHNPQWCDTPCNAKKRFAKLNP